MMKAGLFWTLRRDLYGNGYKFMEVTSTNARGTRYWGRDFEGDATNAASRDCRGKFATIEEARSIVDTIRTIENSYRSRINEHRASITAMERRRDDEIDDAIRSAQKRPAA